MPYSVHSTFRKSKVKWTVWYLSRKIQFNEKAIHLGELWTEYWCDPILKRQKNYKADLGWPFRAGNLVPSQQWNCPSAFEEVCTKSVRTTFQEVNCLNPKYASSYLSYFFYYLQPKFMHLLLNTMVVGSPSGSVPTAGVQHLLHHDVK